MTSLARASLPIALLALLAGCKNNNIKSEQNEYTTETVGSKGAPLTLDDGTSVFIPSMALAEDHEVTLARVASSYPPFTGPAVLSPVYSLEPHDLTFQIAATLSIPATKGTLVFAPEHGSWMDLHGVMDGMGHLSGQSTLAGYFAVIDDGQSGGMGSGTGGAKMIDNPGGPGTNGMQDGVLARSNFAVQASGPGMGTAVGDSYAFFIGQSMDQFGVTTTSLQAITLDTMDAPVTLTTLTDAQAGQNSVAAIGDYAYWSEGMGNPQNPTTIYRMTVGGTRELVGTVGGMAGMTAFSAAAGSLLFVDQSNQLAVYDSATGMLDPTMYGTVTAGGSPYGGAPFTRSEDHVFFLTGGMQTPFEIWAGPIGSPATDSTMNFPGGAMLTAVGASGSTFVIVVSAGTQQNVIAFDTANPTAGSKTIGSFGGGGAAGGQAIAIDGGAVYAATYVSGNATGELVKIDIATGVQSKVGTYLAQGLARPMMLNSQYVFVIGPDPMGMGSDLYRWAR